MRKLRQLVLVISITSSGLAGFGALPAGSTITKSAAQVQFVKDYSALHKKVMTFADAVDRINNYSSDASINKIVNPVYDGFLKFQNQLLSQSWPKNSQSDIKHLRNTIDPINGLLNSLVFAAHQSQVEWASSFAISFTTFGSAVRAVEKDLGLKIT